MSGEIEGGQVAELGSNIRRRSARKHTQRTEYDSSKEIDELLDSLSDEETEFCHRDDSYCKLAEWVAAGHIPVRFIEVTEEDRLGMSRHGKRFRDPTTDVNNKRMRIFKDQPHPLLFVFATRLGLDTSDKVLMAALLRYHGIAAPLRPKPFDAAQHMYNVNEKFEQHIRFVNQQWLSNKEVWPQEMCELDLRDIHAIHEFRTTLLGKLQLKLRKYLTMKNNISRRLPEGGEFAVVCPFSIFSRLLGQTRLFDKSYSRRKGTFIKVPHHPEDGPSLEYLFPATLKDLQSDEELDPVFGHPFKERWYRQYITTPGSTTKFEYRDLTLTYNLDTTTLALRGDISVFTKRVSVESDPQTVEWQESIEGQLLNHLLGVV